MAKDMSKLAADVEERAKALMEQKLGDITVASAKQLERERDHFKMRLEQLQNTVDKFQTDSGLTVNSWGGGAVGDAVRLLHNAHERQQLAHAQTSTERMLKSIGAAAKCLEQMSQPGSRPAPKETRR